MTKTLHIIIILLAANILVAQDDTNTSNKTENKPKVSIRKPKLTQFFEITVGVNNTKMSKGENIKSYADNGWQMGIIRRHQLSRRLDLSYGAMLVKVKHQTAYVETNNNMIDIGERGYSQTYFRVPVDIHYELIPRKSFFIMGGLNVNSVLQNYSAEIFTRTVETENTAKNMWKYRETALLDLGLHLGIGGRVKFGRNIISLSVSYNQGIIAKDMGLQQRQLDCQISTTFPKFGKAKGMNTSYKSSPAPWAN